MILILVMFKQSHVAIGYHARQRSAALSSKRKTLIKIFREWSVNGWPSYIFGNEKKMPVKITMRYP